MNGKKLIIRVAGGLQFEIDGVTKRHLRFFKTESESPTQKKNKTKNIPELLLGLVACYNGDEVEISDLLNVLYPDRQRPSDFGDTLVGKGGQWNALQKLLKNVGGAAEVDLTKVIAPVELDGEKMAFKLDTVYATTDIALLSEAVQKLPYSSLGTVELIEVLKRFNEETFDKGLLDGFFPYKEIEKKIDKTISMSQKQSLQKSLTKLNALKAAAQSEYKILRDESKKRNGIAVQQQVAPTSQTSSLLLPTPIEEDVPTTSEDETGLSWPNERQDSLLDPPVRSIFLGDKASLNAVCDWLRGDKCAVVGLTGLGDVGKSSLVIEAAHRAKFQQESYGFERVIYLTTDGFDVDDITLRAFLSKIESDLELRTELLPLTNDWDRLSTLYRFAISKKCLLIFDGMEKFQLGLPSELTTFLSKLKPDSGSKALLTLSPQQSQQLSDSLKQTYRPREVASCHSPKKAVGFLVLEINQNDQSQDIWDKIPQGTKIPRNKLCDIPSEVRPPRDKFESLTMLAQAAKRHAGLMQMAVNRLVTNDWESVLEQFRNLSGDVGDAVSDMVELSLAPLLKHEANPRLYAQNQRTMELLQIAAEFPSMVTQDLLLFIACHAGKTFKDCDEENAKAYIHGALAKACSLTLMQAQKPIPPATKWTYEVPPMVKTHLHQRYTASPELRDDWRKARLQFYADEIGHDLREYNAKSFNTLSIDRPNLVFMAGQLSGKNEPELTIQFAERLFSFLETRGYWLEGKALLDQAVLAASDLKAAATKKETTTEIQKYRWIEIDCLRRRGIFYRLLGQYAEAEADFERSKKLSEEAPVYIQGLARALLEKGVKATLQRDIGEALHLLERALTLAHETHDKESEARIFRYFGILQRRKGDVNEAEKWLRQSLEIYAELQNDEGCAAALRDLGILYREKFKALPLENRLRESPEFEEARKCFLQSGKFSYHLKDPKGLSTAATGLAELKLELGLLGDAKKYARKAYESAIKINSPLNVVRTLRMRGLVAEAEGNLDLSMDYIEKARDLADQLNLELLEDIEESQKRIGREREKKAFLF